jgi:pilus assembly protein CpaB
VELTRKRTGGGPELTTLLATRRGTLAVALAAVIIAAGIIVLALNRYRHSVNTSNSVESVLVANKPIEKGTPGATLVAQGMYAPAKVLEKRVSPGALTDAAALSGRVAVTNILPGQQLTLTDFAYGGGVATELAANQRAIAIPLDASHGLSGILQTGDHVDVYSGFNAAAGAQVKLLISNVLVLEAGVGGSSGVVGGGNSSGQVVLAVNTNQAAEIAYASDNGKIWLVLRPGNAKNASRTSASIGSILSAAPASGTTGP